MTQAFSIYIYITRGVLDYSSTSRFAYTGVLAKGEMNAMRLTPVLLAVLMMTCLVFAANCGT
jgi:hypothetical protein